MAARGILRILMAALIAVALGLAGVAGADESASTGKVDNGSRGGKATKRAPKGRK